MRGCVVNLDADPVGALSQAKGRTQVDLIGQLYRNVYSPYITAKASYVEYDLSEVDGGGKGGGAGDEMGPMRSEFLDTAVFQQLVCDQQGKASVSFQLPDNVTDWRITAAALCGKKAGDNPGQGGPPLDPALLAHGVECQDVVGARRKAGD